MNSLRLTGNLEPVVVIDAGLTSAQRELLGHTCDVRALPLQEGGSPNFFKPAARLLGLTGVVIFVDSDIIVTSRLDPFFAKATRGQISAFVDDPIRDRQFSDWTTLLPLRGRLRNQPYVNTGFIALDASTWDALLGRWLEFCELVRAKRPPVPFDDRDPFGYMDQDVLNALLMTEVPPECLEILDLELAPAPHLNRSTHVADPSTLRCLNGSQPTVLLHYWDHPKPWLPHAQWTLNFDAYVELLVRALTGADISIRVPRRDLPLWLRTGPVGWVARRAPRRARRAGIAITLLPLRRRARRLAGTALRRLGLR